MSLTPPQLRVLIWLALALGAGLALRLLGPALTPLAMALVFAYLLWPVVGRLERLHLPRVAAVALTVLCAVLVSTLLLLLLVPIVTTLLPQLQAHWPGLVDTFNNRLVPWLAGWGIVLDAAAIKESALQAVGGNMQEWALRVLSSARIGGSWLVTVVGLAVLVPVLMFYLLADAGQLLARLPALVPPRLRPGLGGFFAECDTMLRQYLRGQLTVMGLLALYYAVALTLVGLELAWPIGVFTGLAVFIPYLGFGTGLVLALLTALIQIPGWNGVLMVAGVYAAGQVLEGFFLTPRLVGGRIGLSPLGVIVALLLFAQAFGFVGVFLALPASAVGVVALRRALGAWQASDFYKT